MALEIILQQFPFFQSARALHLKGLYNQESFRYNYELKKTAAHTNDRSILFDFITSIDFNILQKENIDNHKEIISNVTVVDSFNLSNNTETTIETTSSEISKEETIKNVTIENHFNLNNDTDTITSTSSEKDEDEKTEAIEKIEINTIEIGSEVSQPIEVSTNEPKEIVKELIVSKEASITSIEEKLEIGRPLEFNQSEKHSFQEWLQLTKFSPIERETTEITQENEKHIEKEDEKSKKIDLIDRFIELNPKITPVKETTPVPANISKSSEEQTHLMTETLAKIYLEQKKYHKAIQAYEILILKYPEKSSFFANRIKDIKDLQQNNN